MEQLMTKPHQATIVVRLDLELKHDIDRLAEADDRSLNGYIVRLLRQHVAEQQKGKRK